ncbi:MAG: hypothetical protein WCG48_01585 [Candidatus Berkelbacteria bacterium]
MIDWINIKALFVIVSILTVSSFALYFPMAAIFEEKIAAKFAIPVSISVQIIFAYVFYCFGIVKIYPAIYASLIVFINVLAIWKLKHGFFNIRRPSLQQILHILALIILFCVIIYSRFHDSFTNIAPGEIDTYSHVQFIKDLTTQGYLNFPQYAPGFHLFLYPLVFVTKLSEIYRFAGPTIGVLCILSSFLLLKDSFKRTTTRYVFLALCLLPIFNQLFLQQIGFFSTSLSFIFIPSLIFAIYTKKDILPKSGILILYGLIISALSLTLPYLYIQYLPSLALFSIIIFATKKGYSNDYLRKILCICILSFIGFFLAFGHVYLQTKILKRADNFPAMEFTRFENGSLVVSNSYSPTDNPNQTVTPAARSYISTIADHSSQAILKASKKIDPVTKTLKETAAYTKYIRPMLNTANEAFSVKNIRPFAGTLSIGAYVWIFICALVLLYASLIKNTLLLTLSAFTLIFGIATQFGVLEISSYRGRSGWYLLLFMILLVTFLYDLYFPKKFEKKWFIYTAIALSCTLGIAKPPVFYRAYYTDSYVKLKNIVTSLPDKTTLSLLTNDRQLSLVLESIQLTPLDNGTILKPCSSNTCVIIIDKKFFDADPILSQKSIAGDENFSDYYAKQVAAELEYKTRVERIKGTYEFSLYKLYWDDNNTEIYWINNSAK